MTALAYAEPTYRRFEGAGQGIGLGRHCAVRGGTTTKTTENEGLAWPAEAGRAYGAWSDEPMRRPDHKAKKHGRPVRVRKKRRRQLRRGTREAIETAVAGGLAFALTLTLAWPLRFDGEMIWVAMANL